MANIISNSIDTSIWKPYKIIENSGFLTIQIFEHIKNCGNNGDKYLVIFGTDGGQEFQGVCTESSIDISALNDEDYNLPKLKGTGELAFVIVGNIELSDFLASRN